jgi:hypothetical protein
MLAVAGIQADQSAIDSLQRRMGFFQQSMDALDRLDLGMTDPAASFDPTEEGD